MKVKIKVDIPEWRGLPQRKKTFRIDCDKEPEIVANMFTPVDKWDDETLVEKTSTVVAGNFGSGLPLNEASRAQVAHFFREMDRRGMFNSLGYGVTFTDGRKIEFQKMA